jgi:hypothetical protein
MDKPGVTSLYFPTTSHERDVTVRIRKRKFPLAKKAIADNQKEDEEELVLVLAKGSIPVKLELGFEESNFRVGETLVLTACAVPIDSQTLDQVAIISVEGQVTNTASNTTTNLTFAPPPDIKQESQDPACTTATVLATEEGGMSIWVEMSGSYTNIGSKSAGSESFVRSGAITTVVGANLGSVTSVELSDTEVDGMDYIAIRLYGNAPQGLSQQTVIGYVELLGTDQAGQQRRPIASAQHLATIDVSSPAGTWMVELTLHKRWLSRAGGFKVVQLATQSLVCFGRLCFCNIVSIPSLWGRSNNSSSSGRSDEIDI